MTRLGAGNGKRALGHVYQDTEHGGEECTVGPVGPV